jgi:hypothetical protein
MECAKRNDLVLSYLRSQVDQVEVERCAQRAKDYVTRTLLLEMAQAALVARRKALLEHCERHGC